MKFTSFIKIFTAWWQMTSSLTPRHHQYFALSRLRKGVRSEALYLLGLSRGEAQQRLLIGKFFRPF